MGTPDLSTAQQTVLDDVARYGWHCVMVADGTPPFAYSVGLEKYCGGPELIMFGLPINDMHLIISNVANSIRDGAAALDNGRIREILEGFDVALRAVPQDQAENYMTYALWYADYHKRKKIPAAFQVFWPDRAGHFPWEDEWDRSFNGLQPLLWEAS